MCGLLAVIAAEQAADNSACARGNRNYYAVKKYVCILLLLLGAVSCNPVSEKKGPETSLSSPRNQHLPLLEEGIQQYQSGNFDTAEMLFRKIIEEITIKDNEAVIIRAYTNLGNIYADKGQNPRALEFYNTALETAESVAARQYTAHIQKNIGALYVSWKQFDQALVYYHKALETAATLQDEMLIADCYNNIGIVYEQQDNPDAALDIYRKALGIYEKLGHKEGIAMAESNMAIVYRLQKKYALSLASNKRALQVSEDIGDKWTTASILNNIGNLYRETGDYGQAMQYASRSLELAREMDAREIIIMAYETMAFAASESRAHDQALVLYKQYAAVKDSFINIESARQFADLQVKYETGKKQKALAEARLVLAENEVASKQKNIWLLLLGALVIIGFTLFRNARIKALHKQQQLQMENKLLQEQASYKIQEQRLNISRELHDSLGSQLTFIGTVLDGLKNTQEKSQAFMDQKIHTMSGFTEKAIAELKDTIWVLNAKELGLNELKLKMLNFIKHAAEAAETSQFHFDFEVTKDIQLSSKQAMNLFRVFQEIINNSMKHAHADDIFVSINQTENRLIMNVSDNGAGFDFDSRKEESFGLTNIRNRVQELGGILKTETAPGKGTAYFIEISL